MTKKAYFLQWASVFAWQVGCSDQPSIRLTTTNSQATVDVAKWGEYGTVGRRVVLREKSTGRVVWEIQAGTKILVTQFFVSVGVNSTQQVGKHGPLKTGYVVVYPRETDHFTLHADTDYEVEVWTDLNARPSTAVFRFAG